MTEPDPLAYAAMVAYCGWDPTVPVVNQTEVLDGNGTQLLLLPSLHVTAVSSVAVTDAWGTVTTFSAADVPASIGPGQLTQVGWSENGVVTCKSWTLGGVWPEDERNVAVTYSGGYANPPDDLLAALASVSKRTAGPLLGASTRKMGTAVVGFGAQVAAGDLLLIEKMVFDRYRILRAR